MWIPAELHCHTFHSDGQFSPKELCEAAKSKGLKMIALSDHNTMSGFAGLPSDFPVIHGIEWTAFFGHMLVLGAEKYVDWRVVDRTKMDEKIKEIHDVNGLVGIAHPFALGSPLCTGCYWEYEVNDWQYVDYIEVWSEVFPSTNVARCGRAFKMWTDLLDKGYRIAATYGKDWHRLTEEREPWGCTYLEVKDITEQSGLDAIRNGRTIVSMGPLPIVEGSLPGDTLKEGSKVTLTVGMDMSERRSDWERYDFVPETVRVLGPKNEEIERVSLQNRNTKISFTAPEQYFLLVYSGKVMGIECDIAFTSPFYTEK